MMGVNGRRSSSVRGCVTLAVGVMALGLQPAPGLADAANGVELPAGARLVYEDDFSRQELGSWQQGNIDPKLRKKLSWCIRRGDWTVESDGANQGHLIGQGGPASIVLDRKLTSDFRLEYTAWSPHPGDRSALLCVPGANFAYEDVYGFHFAGGYSKYNLLTRLGRALTAQAKRPMPVTGQKCRFVVQKQGALLQMFMDGKAVFSEKDTEYHELSGKLRGALGVNIGLFTWSDGMCFDDLKVYQLPVKQVEILPEEAKAQCLFWRGFESDAEGSEPRDAEIHNGPGCKVLVVNEPTPVYYPKPEGQTLVRDQCVSLQDEEPSEATCASLTLPTGPPYLETGEIEVELLAWHYQGPCVSISLLDQKGQELAAIVVDDRGFFNARTPEGLTRLTDRVSYQNRPRDAPLWLQPKRWFTLRFSFNAKARLFHAALVNLYTGLGRPGISPFVPLGSDLPLLRRGHVAAIRVTTLGRTHVLVDNVCVVTPRAVVLNGEPYSEPLREILDLSYPLRKDPVSLSVYSLRNEPSGRDLREERRNRYRRQTSAGFIQAGIVYNKLLVRYAYLEEHATVLKRMLYHLEQQGRLGSVPKAHLSALDGVASAKNGVEQVLRLYGNAFRDGLDEQTLPEQFYPAADSMRSVLTGLEQHIELLYKSCRSAAGVDLEPLSLAPGPYDAPLEWKNARFERAGRPALFYAPVGLRGADMAARGHPQKLLGLDNCFPTGLVLDRPNQPQRTEVRSFSWDVFDRIMGTCQLDGNPEATIGIASQIGNHTLMQLCPAWWLEQHKEDTDIFFCRRDGSAQNWESGMTEPYKARGYGGPLKYFGGGGYKVRLNIWNPRVRDMYRSVLGEWSQRLHEAYPGRARYFLLSAEPAGYAVTETGFNDSAVAAFRQDLEGEYTTIDALNTAWGASYGSFAEIDPREYSRERPNGLMYEFQRFRHRGYWEWSKLIKDTAKTHQPEMVVLNDYHNALDRTTFMGLDAAGMFKCYDVVGNHYYGKHASKPIWMHRLLDSLRKAYGTALGNYEWIGDVRCSDVFDEHAFKHSGQLEMFEQLAWGRSFLGIWYGFSAGFAEGGQYFVPNLGMGVLRYATTYIPVGRLRSRRFGEIALTYPTAQPKIAVMEATTSWLNGIQVRPIMREVSEALGDQQWNFGYIHEDPLLEGRQSLDGLTTLILPRAVCLRPETIEKLLAWMRGGGTLIALLPPGWLNPFGRPDGRLTREVMGDLNCSFNEEFSQATLEGVNPAKTATEQTGEEDCQLLTSVCGTGRLCIYSAVTPFPKEHLLGLVEQYTPRDVYVEDGHFRVVLREADDHLYVFAVNYDLYESHEDTVLLTGRFSGAVDLGCDAAFPVKAVIEAGTTRIPLRLTPGEGTVIRLSR